MAPALCFKMAHEDYCMLSAFARDPTLAILLRSEVQPTARLIELITAKAHTGICPADAMLGADALLCAGANRVLAEPNAGGASRVSESLSAEVLERAFGAVLLQTECEIVYWPTNGSITDFSIDLCGTTLGVSVTRALGAPGKPYTAEAADSLLRKKLAGILRSTSNANGQWEKQILHIWAPSVSAADAIEAAYAGLDERQLVAGTIVLISVCELLPALFEEKASTPPRGACALRAVKGAKDAAHLRVLAESNPLRVR